MEADPEYAAKRREMSAALKSQKIKNDPEFAVKCNEQSLKIVREKRKVVANREAEKETDRKAKELLRLKKEEKKKENRQKVILDRELKMNEFFKYRIDYIDRLKIIISNKNSSKEQIDSAKRLLTFIKEVREVPSHICLCCECLYFSDYVANANLNLLFQKYEKSQKVKKSDLKNDKISKNESIVFSSFDNFKSYIIGFDSNKICLNCKRNLENGKIPLINPQCGIKVDDVPEEISSLSDFEEFLLAPLKPFMQIISMQHNALNPQLGIKGAVINIIPKTDEMLEVLPRQFNSNCTIQIDFKRDLSHKTSYMCETVSVSKMMAALKILVNTELYKEFDIKIDEKAFEQYDPKNVATQLNFIADSKTKEIAKQNILTKYDEIDVNSSKISNKQEFNQVIFNSLIGKNANFQYTLFENTFDVEYEINKMIKLYSMCAYNSIVHGLIMLYKTNSDFSIYVELQKDRIELFNFLSEIIHNNSKDQMYKKYFYFIYATNSINLTNEMVINMENDSGILLEKFLTPDLIRLHASYRKRVYCNKPNCKGISSNCTESSNIMINLSNREFLHEQLETKIIKLTKSIEKGEISYECNDCKLVINDADCSIRDINCSTEYNDFLIVNVMHFNPIDGTEALRNFNIYTEVPLEIKIEDETFNLAFFINKSLYHYKTFFRHGDNFILLDDSYCQPNAIDKYRCEKLVDQEDLTKGVNPSVLVYHKNKLNRNKQINIIQNENDLDENLLRSLNKINFQCDEIRKNIKIDFNSSLIKKEEVMKEITQTRYSNGSLIQEDVVMKEIEEIKDLNWEDVEDDDENVQHPDEVMLLKDVDVDDVILDTLETDVKINIKDVYKKNVKIIAPGQGKKPVPSRLFPHYDEMCFPKTYGGKKMTYDRKRISYTKLIRAEIKHYKRKRCRTKMILFKVKEKIKRDLGNAINVAMRKTYKGQKLTAKDVRDGKMLDKVISDNLGYRVFPSIRIGPMYFKMRKNHAIAMIRQMGNPQWFVTLSMGENFSPELLKLLVKIESGKDISLLEALNLKSAYKSKLVRDDPVSCAEYFNHRVNKLGTFCSDKKGNGLLGKRYVTNYIKRKEAQGRGTMHSHQIWWCKNTPNLNPYEKDPIKREANEKEVVECIDDTISTEYRENNPNMNFHIHKCTKTCHKGKKGDEVKCRFGFPHFVSNKTMVLYPMPKKDITGEMINRLKRIREKMKYFRQTRVLESFEQILKDLNMSEEQYFEATRCAYKRIDILYKRESNAVDINTYNKILFEVWEGNHDMQYIPDPYGFVNYLSKYCLKADEGILDMMKKAEEECKSGNKTLLETLRKIANIFHGSSFIGAQQAVEEIEGFAVLRFSNAEKFINTNRPEKRICLRKGMKELDKLDDDDNNITNQDFIDIYSKRPTELDGVWLADFAALYKREGQSENQSDIEGDSDDDENNHKIRSKRYVLRTKTRIIRYVHFRKEICEKEYRREMVMLFTPWRNEEEEILNQNNVDRVFSENYANIMTRYAKYNCITPEELERLIKEVDEGLKVYKDEEIDAFNKFEEELDHIPKVDIFEELGIDPKEKDEMNIKQQKDGYVLTRPPKVDTDELHRNLRMLNQKQQQFVQHVFHIVKTKKEHEVYPKILLLGPAGTGKSLVLKTLNQLITHYFDNVRNENPDDPKVLLAGYTGIAAFNIGGNTCHNAFALKIGYKGKSLESESTKNTIRSAHREIKMIIIDEVSFISREIRNQIDMNCRKIYGNDHDSFGGKLTILMGDLKQLQSPSGNKIFKTLQTMKRKMPKGKDLMAEIICDNVWNEFELFQLTEIVRQKDSGYQTALNNLANGRMTDEDLALINKRVFKSEDDIPVEAVHLFYTNAEVTSYNTKKIHLKQGELYESKALDQIKGDKVAPDIKLALLEDYAQETVPSVSVKPIVFIKLGIKYMNLVNLDVEDGLVNGAFGILEHLTFNEKNEPIVLWLNFNNPKIGNKARMPFIDYMKENKIPLHLVPLKKYTFDMTTTKKSMLRFKVLHEAFRTQFSVTPCEAMTIHKVQGLTLPKICLDLRYLKRDLTKELKYVALSRCDFQGLYILGEFKKPKNDPEDDVDKEIERLEREKPLKLSFYNFQHNKGKKIIYHNVRSFAAHKNDIKCSNWYWRSDVLILTESNVTSVDKSDIRDNFNILYPLTSDAINQKERSKGIIILCKDTSDVKDLSPSNIISGKNIKGEKWHVDLRTFVISDHYIITGYKSPKTPVNVFINTITMLLTNVPKDHFVTIMGDFNFNMFENNPLKKVLEDHNLINILGDTKTTDCNTQIDIVFSTSTNGISGNYASYFSDHFAIFYQTEYDYEMSNIHQIVDNVEENCNQQYNNVEMEDIDDDMNPVIASNKRKLIAKSTADIICPIIEQSSKRQKRVFNEVQTNNTNFNYAIMRNIISYHTENDYMYRLDFICTFNSFLHAFIACYKIINQFAEYVNNNSFKFRYFENALQIMNATSEEEREKIWFFYIFNNVPHIRNPLDREYPFRLIDKTEFGESYIMRWIQESMIATLLKGFVSYSLEFECENCRHQRTRNISLFSLMNINKKANFSNEIQKIINKKIREISINCSKCSRNVRNFTIQTNEVIIFTCDYGERSQQENIEIPLKDIPKTIKIGEKAFELLFIINNIKNEHFNSFVLTEDKFLYLDDVPQQELIIDNNDLNNQKIYPVIMVFISS